MSRRLLRAARRATWPLRGLMLMMLCVLLVLGPEGCSEAPSLPSSQDELSDYVHDCVREELAPYKEGIAEARTALESAEQALDDAESGAEEVRSSLESEDWSSACLAIDDAESGISDARDAVSSALEALPDD